MQTPRPQDGEILYALTDVPSVSHSTTAALQHIMACFIGIITPTLIIGSVLGLEAEIPYLISMALMTSGVSTFIQAKKFGPIGCGLIAVQGTSFTFISALLVAGTTIKSRGGSNDEILALMFGLCFFGAFVEIILSRFIQHLKAVITPLTTGIVITTIGITLIKVGMTDLSGGFNAPDFGAVHNLLLGLSVLITVIALNASKYPLLRLSAIFIGMLVGCFIAWWQGILTFDNMIPLPLVSVPQPFKYGIAFDWSLFIPIALVYFLSAIETSGDLTANSLFCKEPIKGPIYIERIKGGVLADGVNSMLAAMFNSFPNTTFGQNNAVIQMTGVASRHVGFYIAGLLLLLGLFPVIGSVLQLMPKPVLGGATLVMFATIAVAGVKILTSEPIDRRKSLIIATSLGLGLGVMMVPETLAQLPQLANNILSSSVTTAGFCAIIMSIVIPEKKTPPELPTTSEHSPELGTSETDILEQANVAVPNPSKE
ncbi:nucleobase:cation symporter-2 family protein [Paraglaciecola chathamensis]|uniref:uracil-xanthine permease family protein n=1 Tax=Paraglaciecola chathamensis TaxID=368405 RepID=UPI0027085814|nr:nucleobase:cation symporter-2 family protein [Paraglaciecola chathamensis]MDO6841031.1 nucleobase:cation symporter-2 family protein [Paraglaciecola chathamensis]